jgi:HlyD family secretion protein
MKYVLLIISCSLMACSGKLDTQALGTLERDRIVLKATAAEIITATPILEGQNVKEGDLLLQLDDNNQKNQVAKAEANVASAKASLAKLQQGARREDIAGARTQVTSAQANLIEAQKTFDRVSTLVAKKLTGIADLDAARARRDSAAAQLERAKQGLLVLTNGSREEDIEQAEAQLQQANAALQLEQHHLQELNIRATRSGRLDRLPKHLGERTNVGDAVAIILASNAPYARVYIPETARVNIIAGQTLHIHVDGIKDSVAGKVRWISQDPAFTPYYALNSSDRARLVYLAEIQLPDSAQNFPSGVPVQVDLANKTE